MLCKLKLIVKNFTSRLIVRQMCQLLSPLRESMKISCDQRSIDVCTGLQVQIATTDAALSSYQLKLEDKILQLGKPKIENIDFDNYLIALNQFASMPFPSVSTKLRRRNITRDLQCVERCAPQCLDFILAHFRFVAILFLLLMQIHCRMGSIEPSIVAFNLK